MGAGLPKLGAGLGGAFFVGLAAALLPVLGVGLLRLLLLLPGRGMRLPGMETVRGTAGAALPAPRVVDVLRETTPLEVGLGLPRPAAPGLRVPQLGPDRGGDSGSSFLGGGLDSIATLQAWMQVVHGGKQMRLG